MNEIVEAKKIIRPFRVLLAIAVLTGVMTLVLLFNFPTPNTMTKLSQTIVWGLLIGLVFLLGMNFSVSQKFENRMHSVFGNTLFRSALMSISMVSLTFGLFFKSFLEPARFYIFEIYLTSFLALVDWGMMLALLLLIAAYYSGQTGLQDYKNAFSLASVVFFPLVVAMTFFISSVDPDLYFEVGGEDQIAEWLTFAGLMGAGLLALFLATKERKKPNADRYTWFLIAFGLAMIFAALEEISYGQRIFDVKTPAFFMENSTQQEINAHNVFTMWVGVQTKDVVAFGMLGYGLILPLLALIPRLREVFNRLRVLVPPLTLAVGVGLGGFLIMGKNMAGREEEIGEMVLALCLFWIMAWAALIPQRAYKEKHLI